MSDLEATVAALAAKVAEMEDRLAIYQLLATYGPAVDSGLSGVTADLWSENGTYDWGMGKSEGSAAVGAMVEGDQHQGIIGGGSAHFLGTPHLDIHADRAVATGYSQLLLFDKEQQGFRVWRVAANRWELERTPQGWKVVKRVNRVLDGSEEARSLLRAGVERGTGSPLE